MSNYKDAFEAMATRGTPVGATSLLERTREDLSGVTRLVEPSKPPRFSGLAVAAAVFVVVIAVGGLFAFLSRQTDEIAGDVDAFGIEWLEGPFAGLVGGPTSGPGGFVKPPFGPDNGSIEFSSDGQTWTPVWLTGWSRQSWARILVASDTLWMVAAEDGSSIGDPWLSPDGQAWTQVEWGPEMTGIVADVVTSGDGFLATTDDAFGVGLQYWWSSDGVEWAEVENVDFGGPGRYRLWGTSGGILAVPDQAGTEATLVVQRSIDGSSWVDGEMSLPAEVAASAFRWHLSAVAYFGDQWIAVAELDRTGVDPVVVVWTSPDGVTWASSGTVDFGLESGMAATSLRVAAIGDVVAVSFDKVPVAEGDDGLRRAGGYSDAPGEIWVSDDARSWTKALEIGSRLMGLAGTITGDGRAVGLWMGFPQSTQNEEPVVATTGIVPPPQEIDPAGIALQDRILADGEVTQDEYIEAMEGWKRCMEERGIERVAYDEVTARGGGGRQYGSPTAEAGEAADAACEASYLTRVQEAVWSQ